jgi:hypothetical protein
MQLFDNVNGCGFLLVVTALYMPLAKRRNISVSFFFTDILETIPNHIQVSEAESRTWLYSLVKYSTDWVILENCRFWEYFQVLSCFHERSFWL